MDGRISLRKSMQNFYELLKLPLLTLSSGGKRLNPVLISKSVTLATIILFCENVAGPIHDQQRQSFVLLEPFLECTALTTLTYRSRCFGAWIRRLSFILVRVILQPLLAEQHAAAKAVYSYKMFCCVGLPANLEFSKYKFQATGIAGK